MRMGSTWGRGRYPGDDDDDGQHLGKGSPRVGFCLAPQRCRLLPAGSRFLCAWLGKRGEGGEGFWGAPSLQLTFGWVLGEKLSPGSVLPIYT